MKKLCRLNICKTRQQLFLETCPFGLRNDVLLDRNKCCTLFPLWHMHISYLGPHWYIEVEQVKAKVQRSGPKFSLAINKPQASSSKLPSPSPGP